MVCYPLATNRGNLGGPDTSESVKELSLGIKVLEMLMQRCHGKSVNSHENPQAPAVLSYFRGRPHPYP